MMIKFMVLTLLSLSAGCVMPNATTVINKPDPAIAIHQKYVNEHPELSAKDVQRILDGTIWIGMTKEEFLASMAYQVEPYNKYGLNRISKHVSSSGVYEIWGVSNIGWYFYFTNDRLTDWSER